MKPLLVLTLACAPLLASVRDVNRRLVDSGTVFSEIMRASDKGIPQDLLEKAHCMVIVPGMKKGALIVGAEFGKGFMTCRNDGNGAWSAPGAVRVEGGSLGLQIGGSETDLVMLIMNQRGAEKLMSSEFTLGGEGELAAGPIGRTATAETDAQMRAQILSWSRSKGVFAGISLKGATLRQDKDANEEMYGKRLDNRQIVTSNMAPPQAAHRLLALLQRYPARMTS